MAGRLVFPAGRQIQSVAFAGSPRRSAPYLLLLCSGATGSQSAVHVRHRGTG